MSIIKYVESKRPVGFSIKRLANRLRQGVIPMKLPKQILLCGTFVMFCVPAYAVTKCVKLSSSTTCSYVNPGTYVVDWTSNCTSSGTSVAISGISQCSSTSGSSVGQKATSLEISGGTDDKYCWCKMVSTAVSSWVFFNGYGSASNCAYVCASACASPAANNAAFRSALFSGLGDCYIRKCVCECIRR